MQSQFRNNYYTLKLSLSAATLQFESKTSQLTNDVLNFSYNVSTIESKDHFLALFPYPRDMREGFLFQYALLSNFKGFGIVH